MYDAFVAYGLQYLLHKRRMKFYRKMYAAALLSEFLQHVGRIYNRKESAMSKYVLKLLESYNERERKIAVLRYNLEHPTTVSRAEQIEAMNFRHGDSLGHSAGHISNKTLYIALNYEEQAERMNAESAHEIAKELFALECEQKILRRCMPIPISFASDFLKMS